MFAKNPPIESGSNTGAAGFSEGEQSKQNENVTNPDTCVRIRTLRRN